jgi:hypothetical protein
MRWLNLHESHKLFSYKPFYKGASNYKCSCLLSGERRKKIPLPMNYLHKMYEIKTDSVMLGLRDPLLEQRISNENFNSQKKRIKMRIVNSCRNQHSFQSLWSLDLKQTLVSKSRESTYCIALHTIDYLTAGQRNAIIWSVNIPCLANVTAWIIVHSLHTSSILYCIVLVIIATAHIDG